MTGEHEEELPDYIMVMVANQRSRDQMQDELGLFLADQTDEFVEWLHSKALKKISPENNEVDEEKLSQKNTKKNRSPPSIISVPSTSRSKDIPKARSPVYEAPKTEPPSPPSPVIIINSTDREPRQEEPRQEILPAKAPISLASTIGKVIRQSVEEEEDYDDQPNGNRLSSIIQVKQRVFVPDNKQAAGRLFSAQTKFLNNGGNSKNQPPSSTELEQNHADKNEDLRSILEKKKKRKLDLVPIQAAEIQNDEGYEEEQPAKKTRFIVTLNGAIERQLINLPLVEAMQDEQDAEEIEEEEVIEAQITELCKFYPNCKNSSCVYVHSYESPSQTLCK